MMRSVLAIVSAALVAAIVVPVEARQLESFKVRGQWVITVMNPDGSVASKQEFDNALTFGNVAIAQLLTREKAAREWLIFLMTQGAAVSPFTLQPVPGGPDVGMISEAAGFPTVSHPSLFKTLEVSTVGTTGLVELNGSATAQRDGLITAVETAISLCPMATPNCDTVMPTGSNTTLVPFSAKAITQPLTAKQIVQVSVKFSFSTAATTTTQH